MTHVSVIIPAKNAAETLGECLAALAQQRGEPTMEVLVVDDGSRDATRSIALAAGARVVDGPGQGPAIARNRGATAARGDILLFLDADTAPRPDWLAAMVRPFDDPRVAGVKGAYETTQRSAIARFVQIEFEAKYERLARAQQIDFIDTGTAAYRKDVFVTSGGFDESFPIPSAEDVDLSYRLATAGHRLVFVPAAIVRHRHADHLVSYLLKKFWYGFYRMPIYRRFPLKALGDSYTPPTMGLQIGLAGLADGMLLLGILGWRRGLAAGMVALATFGATTLPLVRRTRRTHPNLAPLVPVLVFARATAQGLGIASGALSLFLRLPTRRG